MSLKNLVKLLPDPIKVTVIKGKSGVLIAELKEYDIFTEAESFNELIFNINDLIYTYFEIPKKYQGKIFYIPEKPEDQRIIDKSVLFNILASPHDICQNYNKAN